VGDQLASRRRRESIVMPNNALERTVNYQRGSNMTLHSFAGIVTLSVLLAGCATAQTPGSALPVERGTLSGRVLQLDYWYSVAPDCSTRGDAEIRVLTQPSHGSLRVEKGEDFPAFSKDNARHECNKRKVPVMFIYYQSVPGFAGTDSTTVQILFPGGSARTVTYKVNVSS
jgi:hypothetical protein